MNSFNALTIDEIIQARKNHAEKAFNPILNKLNQIISRINDLESMKDEILRKISEKDRSNTIVRIDKLLSINNNLKEYASILKKLLKRFNRETLNIGVLGYAGEGKSTLLGSITGSPELFPVSDENTCTVAPSIVENRSNKEIKVSYHTQTTLFSEVIFPLFKKFDAINSPNNFSEWENDPEPRFIIDEGQKDITQVFESIRNEFNLSYLKYLKDYKNKLGSSEISINASEIIKNVTRIYDRNGNLTNPECLAVKEVSIKFPFKKSEVGPIALIDMPGSGTFRLTDETLMLNMLNDKVDILLYILKPIGRYEIEKKHLALYGKINLNQAKKRTFIILNRHETDSKALQRCEAIKKIIEQPKKFGIEWPNSGVIIANCKDSDKINSNVMTEIVNHLQHNITQLDKNYADSTIKKIRESLDSLNIILEESKFYTSRAMDKIEFSRDIEKLISNLSQSLGILLEKLKRNTTESIPSFLEKIKEVIKECQDSKELGIPDHDEITKEIYMKGGSVAKLAEYLDEQRAHISKFFIELDYSLQEYLEQIKNEVVNDLKLSGLENFGKSENGSDFLKKFLTYFPNDLETNGELETLLIAFKRLAEYDVSYSGVISKEIRDELRSLNSYKSIKAWDPQNSRKQLADFLTFLSEIQKGTTSFGQPIELSQEKFQRIIETVVNLDQNMSSPTALNNMESSDQSPVQIISEFLSKAYDQALIGCQKRLKKICVKPNEIAYAMVEEFRDYIVYSRGNVDQWRVFMAQNEDILQPPSDNDKLIKRCNDMLENISLTSKELKECIESYII